MTGEAIWELVIFLDKCCGFFKGFEKNESLNCLEAKQNKTLKVSSLVLIWQIAFAELADVMRFSTVFGTTEYCNGYDGQI